MSISSCKLYWRVRHYSKPNLLLYILLTREDVIGAYECRPSPSFAQRVTTTAGKAHLA